MSLTYHENYETCQSLGQKWCVLNISGDPSTPLAPLIDGMVTFESNGRIFVLCDIFKVEGRKNDQPYGGIESRPIKISEMEAVEL